MEGRVSLLITMCCGMLWLPSHCLVLLCFRELCGESRLDNFFYDVSCGGLFMLHCIAVWGTSCTLLCRVVLWPSHALFCLLCCVVLCSAPLRQALMSVLCGCFTLSLQLYPHLPPIHSFVSSPSTFPSFTSSPPTFPSFRSSPPNFLSFIYSPPSFPFLISSSPHLPFLYLSLPFLYFSTSRPLFLISSHSAILSFISYPTFLSCFSDVLQWALLPFACFLI